MRIMAKIVIAATPIKRNFLLKNIVVKLFPSKLKPLSLRLVELLKP